MTITTQPPPNYEPVPNSLTLINDYGLTGLLLILGFLAIFKGIPTLWRHFEEISRKRDEFLEKMMQWQKESNEKLSEAIQGLKTLHDNEINILNEINRKIDR